MQRISKDTQIIIATKNLKFPTLLLRTKKAAQINKKG